MTRYYIDTAIKPVKKKSAAEQDAEVREYLARGGVVKVLPPCQTLPHRRVRAFERAY